MKNLTRKTRTKIEDLTELQGSVERKELSNNQLRLAMLFRPLFITVVATSVIGCLGPPDEGHDPDLAEEELFAAEMDGEHGAAVENMNVGEASQAFPDMDVLGGSDVIVTATRNCDEEFDCNTSCDCISGTCQPGFGFSPQPSPEYCAQPPRRACSTSSDCRTSCTCFNGYCQWNSFGPVPADHCAQPPPDAYEDNNQHTSATHYLGYPQVAHNFHDRGDVDWILVYFGVAMTATFETYDLANANTYLQVYAYDYTNRQLGSLVGANDDMCPVWWHPQCVASRVVLGVPAGSIYAIRITNTTDGSRSVYDPYAPGYSFRIY